MKQLFSSRMFARLGSSPLWLFSFGFLALGACSKNDVQITAQPVTPPVVTRSAPTPPVKTAAERVVEIDKLLAIPLTGSPDEADRRSALRAERDALVSSGQVPYRPPMVAGRNVTTPPNNTVTQRSANGTVVNYAAPTSRTEPITVAPNSQEKNLAFLEQMTPAERERYYKAIKVHNTNRLEVDVQRR